MWYVSVDTGGTFTDVVVQHRDGSPRGTHKLPSTPDDPGRAVVEGIEVALSRLGGALADVSRIVHGTTVATNALLENKGAHVAFVTTGGFEDTLHIGRQHRPDLYALAVRPRRPPVAICVGVDERARFDGSIQKALTADEIQRVVALVLASGAESVAVSLLHSYANADHEARLGAALRSAAPALHITLSHELLPEIREYERGMTCAVNAAVGPIMDFYLSRLAGSLGADRLRIMGSAGGSLTVEEATAAPARTVVSGPAGGVVGAQKIATADGYSKIVTFDMGGTSTDVALVNGTPGMTSEGQIRQWPVRLPMIDIHTVGAGGGSIAHVDAGGALRVGPESAGAVPGPACYGHGGPEAAATVTDANVVLGHIRPEAFLGGGMSLSVVDARGAIGRVAAAAGLTERRTAAGIRAIAEAVMARAIRRISVERGHDVRDFALFCFGGAGGLHACALADRLGMTTVLVPRDPGLLSAVGMGMSQAVVVRSQAIMRLACWREQYPDLSGLPAVADALSRLHDKVVGLLNDQAIGPDDQVIKAELDVRYRGQSYEIAVPAASDAAALFVQAHQALYGTTSPERALEVVAVRVRGEGRLALAETSAAPPMNAASQPTDGVVDREGLSVDTVLTGPMVITEYSSTTVVPQGWLARVLPSGTLELRKGAMS